MQNNNEYAADYCPQMVRQSNSDRYLAGLLAPESMRSHLWAIYAFDSEIARVRSLVSEPAIAEVRYQWWREAIDGIYEQRPQPHPVLTDLANAIRAGDLPRHAFINLIEARRFDLYDDPMPSLNDLEGYLGETSSAIMQLVARVLAGEAALALTDVVGLAGVAFGICDIMRNLSVHGARGQCYVPADMLAKYDLTPAHVISRRRGEALDVVLSQLRHHAQKRLSEAREQISDVPVSALPALWPASLTDLYFKRLARAGFDPFTKIAEVSQMRRQAQLMKLSLTESF